MAWESSMRSHAVWPYADLLWWETSAPNLEEAELFAEASELRIPRLGIPNRR